MNTTGVLPLAFAASTCLASRSLIVAIHSPFWNMPWQLTG